MKEREALQEFVGQMASTVEGKHCDIYPGRSYQRFWVDKNGTRWTEGMKDSIPKQFPILILERIPENVKQCPDCSNIFDKDEEFMDGLCLRSWERIHITGDRDKYIEVKRRQFEKERKGITESNV